MALPHRKLRTFTSASPTRSADRAPGYCVLRRAKGCAPFPRTLSPASGVLPSLRSGRFLLTKPNTSCTIEMPASLRSDGVRVHPGMLFGFPPEYAFSFAGIPKLAGGLTFENTTSQAKRACATLGLHGKLPDGHRLLQPGPSRWLC